MRCLFVFPNAALSPNFSGGASRHLQAFLALTELGIEVHVVRLLAESVQNRVLSLEQQEVEFQAVLRDKAQSWQDVIISRSRPFKNSVEAVTRLFFQPYVYQFPELESLRSVLQIAINTFCPDFIWAEWVLCAALVSMCGARLPWVYGHTDWLFRIRNVKQKHSGHRASMWRRLETLAMYRVETDLVRQCNVVVSGSHSEAADLLRYGARAAYVIPTTYESLPPPSPAAQAATPVRITHLGSLGTSANKMGLLSYLEKVHPRLVQYERVRKTGLRVLVIGETDRANNSLIEKLSQENLEIVGHVLDLRDILRPFDVSIIPYEHNTGTRTKLSLLFNHAQVVVATAASVAGSSEVHHRENCLVLPSLDDFADALIELIEAPALRVQIGRAAKATFDREFTLQSQLPKFGQVLSELGLG